MLYLKHFCSAMSPLVWHKSMLWCISWPYSTNSLLLIDCALSKLSVILSFKPSSFLLYLFLCELNLKYPLLLVLIPIYVCVTFQSFPLFCPFYLDVIFYLYLGSLPTFIAILYSLSWLSSVLLCCHLNAFALYERLTVLYHCILIWHCWRCYFNQVFPIHFFHISTHYDSTKPYPECCLYVHIDD